MTKAPTPTEMSKGQSDNINKATKNSITQVLSQGTRIQKNVIPKSYNDIATSNVFCIFLTVGQRPRSS